MLDATVRLVATTPPTGDSGQRVASAPFLVKVALGLHENALPMCFISQPK